MMANSGEKIIYSNFIVSIVIVIYRIILDYSYVSIVSPLYSSNGLINFYTITNYVISWLFLLSLIPFIWQLNKNHSFSNSVLLIFTAISMIPTTTLIAYMNLEAKFVILNYIYWFCFYVYNALFPQIKIKNSFKTKKLFYGICFLLCFTVVYISGKYTGFRFHWNIVDVYDLRFEERELNINILLQYLHNAAGVLLPIILIYFILNRNKIASFLLMTIILLNFGIGGHKSVLFSLVLTVVGFYFYKYRRTVFVFSFFAVINLIGFLEFIVVKTNFIGAIISYRLLFLPALLNYHYYDFFKNNELDFFRQSFLRWFNIESPYKDNIAFMIGGMYYGNYEIRGNNGLFTDAYYNMGIMGIILFPLILVFILRLIESVSKGIKEGMMFVVVFSVGVTLLSTTFTIALLNNGIILMMIMLYFLPRRNIA